MKNILKPLFAIILFTGIYANPVIAQPGSNEITASSDTDRDDDSGKWGLLGLLGFLGLIKWNNNHKTSTYSSSHTPQNR